MTETAQEMDRLREFTRRMRDVRFEGNDSALARAMGVSQSTVQRFLGGKTIRLDVMRKIAKVAGVDLAVLLRGDAPEIESSPKPPSSVVVKDPPDANNLRRLGDVPGWDEAVEEALELFGDSLTRDDYDQAAQLRGLDLPERVDAAAAAHWAKTCAWQRDRNERMRKEMAEAAAELAAWRKAQGQK